MSDHVRADEVAIINENPMDSCSGAFVIARSRGANCAPKKYLYSRVSPFYKDKFSNLIRGIPDTFLLSQQIGKLSGDWPEYAVIDRIDHVRDDDSRFYSSVLETSDRTYEGVPEHLSVSEGMVSESAFGLEANRDFLTDTRGLKNSLLKISPENRKYAQMVMSQIKFYPFEDFKYRPLGVKIGKNYKKFQYKSSSNIYNNEILEDGTIVFYVSSYRVLSDGKNEILFPLEDESVFEPGEGFNIGEKMHNHESLCYQRMKDNGLEVSEICYKCALVTEDPKKATMPYDLREGFIKLANRDGVESDYIPIGDGQNIIDFGALTNNHRVRAVVYKVEEKTGGENKQAELKNKFVDPAVY